MCPSVSETIAIQAQEHPLEFSDNFRSIEGYCLFLMHRRAYEEASQRSKGLAVLDLGCNNGYGTNLMAASAASVVGCDVSESALADARKRFPKLDFRHVNGISLPFSDDQFDLVTSFQVIEHIADTAAYLAEITRVLRKGGTVLFTTPNAAIRLDPGMRPWNRFHVREYRANELAEALRGTFAQIDVSGLFALEELYQVEYRRCQRALEFNRNLPPPSGELQKNLANLVKAALPAPVVGVLRRMKNGPPAAAEDGRLDPSVQQRFSTKDLHYATTDLDRSLDLLAICLNNKAS